MSDLSAIGSAILPKFVTRLCSAGQITVDLVGEHRQEEHDEGPPAGGDIVASLGQEEDQEDGHHEDAQHRERIRNVPWARFCGGLLRGSGLDSIVHVTPPYRSELDRSSQPQSPRRPSVVTDGRLGEGVGSRLTAR
jgi:hypothetical protein